jgi:uncharacterized phage infection (PIP) family protein YhgE
MGYWVPSAGIGGFVRKYMSIIVAVAALAAVVGAFSGYTTYVLSTGGFGVPANATVEGLSLSACVNELGLVQLNLTACSAGKEAAENLRNECTANLEQLSTSLAEAHDKLSACNLESSTLEEEVASYKNQVDQLKTNLTACKADVSDWLAQVDKLAAEINGWKSNATALQEKYDTVVANSAKVICCMQKIYNPALKYYYVESGADATIIKCTADASDALGTKEFECF